MLLRVRYIVSVSQVIRMLLVKHGRPDPMGPIRFRTLFGCLGLSEIGISSGSIPVRNLRQLVGLGPNHLDGR